MEISVENPRKTANSASKRANRAYNFIFFAILYAFLFVFSGLLFFSAERLIVNNIEITDFTRTTDLLGDGSIVFEPESSTLTLNGANITKGVSGKGTLIITGEKKSTLSINGMGNSPA